jgi:hypothetical protein
MTTPSMAFKRMLCKYDKGEREQILNLLRNWLMQQVSHDQGASMCYNSIQEAYQVNSWSDNKAFKDHYLWFSMPNHDACRSFQEIVKAKLAVPKTNMALAIAAPSGAKSRKPIPKKIRGEVWKNHFQLSTKGACFCCKKELDAFDDWHAGHIISRANNGADTASNLRPVCGSCNLSMGTENMDEFKTRCYP